MSRGNATLKDLAKKLDVSIATVSRALSGHDRISPATRERVEIAAREIGYCPNRAAKALVSGRTGLAALVLPAGESDRCGERIGAFITKLGAALSRRGIDLIVSPLSEDRSETEALSEMIRSRKADGIILTRIRQNDPRLVLLTERRFPHVACGPLDPGMVATGAGAATAWVAWDAAAAAARATQFLLSLGHRRFLLIRDHTTTTFAAQWVEGVGRALRAAGDTEARVVAATVSRRNRILRERDLRRQLLRPRRPTAVLATDDDLALSVLDAAERMQVDVPRELSVVGFGDFAASAHRPPGLTTFDPDLARFTEMIAQALETCLHGEPQNAPPAPNRITPRMVLRGSHGPAPRDARPRPEFTGACYESV